MEHFAGLDWGSAEHAACVVDAKGTVVAELEVAHTADGLAGLIKRLARVGPPESLSIAIERPSGLVVDTLVDAGHPVVPIHPNALKACRPRYSAAGGKSDAGDAYILADVLRTDGHRFRVLKPASDEVRALRALVRSRGALVAEKVAIANHLRAIVEGFWPGAAAIFAAIDSGISLAFLERYPTPKSTRCLGEKRMASFLATHRYRGRRTPTELLERLRSAPTGLAGEFEEDAKGELVKALAAALRTLVGRIRVLSSRIEHDVAQLQTGRIVMSLPRAGKLNAAQRRRSRRRPVTHASGKSRGVVFRYACNKRLRVAMTTWADNSRHASPGAKSVYTRARARGCDHPHAVRILARAWVRVLWRCWHSGQPHDMALHGAARPFLDPADFDVRTAVG